MEFTPYRVKKLCPSCHQLTTRSRHHLYPATGEPKVEEVWVDLCKGCHKWLHKMFHNHELRTLGLDQLNVRMNYKLDNGDREYGKA